MRFERSNILITGAAGGIGSCVAKRLASSGAGLLLTDYRREPLDELAGKLLADGVRVKAIAADIGAAADRKALANAAEDFGVDVLINIAGINPFGMFSEQSDAEIEKAIAINALAPMLLCRAMLPVLSKNIEAHIVNVGSIFGSLGYPGFAVYSASKFAVRGFTEALRRELADTAIRLHYVAPRATQTALSTDRISAMNKELKVATDKPEVVAAAIERTLSHSRREVYLGRPERLVALLNSVVPGVIDRFLRKQLAVIRRYAMRRPGDAEASEKQAINMEILGVES
jgi:short-subunit dehydrogenase